jgi:hypothetical protein
MGTRSLTFVYDDKEPMINMYRQFDGYPSHHGSKLAEFLNSFDAIVNGIRVGDNRKIANGMGCLAAQLIAHFKIDAGGFYMYPVTAKDCGQEYEYHVYENKVVVKNPTEVIFSGTWREFNEFCSAEELA